MQKLVLDREVIVKGRGFLGLSENTLIFSPAGVPGWYWDCGKSLVPIDVRSVGMGLHNFVLKNGSARLSVYEHIGALKAKGLDGVIIKGLGSPPFFGRSFELWEALVPHTKICESESNPNVTWLRGANCYHKTHAMIPAGFLEYTPWNQKVLLVKISIDYPGLGAYNKQYVVPNAEDLDKIFLAHTQGYPPSRKWVADMVCWPHRHRVVWPQNQERQKTLELFCDHRCADLLGALSLVSSEHQVAGKVVSHGAGHVQDLHLVSELFNNNTLLK